MNEPTVIEGSAIGSGKRVAIVVSRWNEFVTKDLLEGAVDELRKCGCQDMTIVYVPGTWEMPPAVERLIKSAKKPDAIIAVGCILMGQTAHGRLLSGDVSGTLMRLQVDYSVPIGWAVLTPDNTLQAIDRAGMKMGNKGREAVLAALELSEVLKKIQ